MSSHVQPSRDEATAPGATALEPTAGSDYRRLDLIALMSITAVCTAICLLAGPGALQAVIGAAGILFAAWRTPRRFGQEPGRRRR